MDFASPSTVDPTLAVPSLGLTQVSQRNPTDPEQVRQAGQAFEAYFIASLLKTMRATVPKGLFSHKHEDTLYYLYDQELARLAAERGGLGFGTLIESQLSGTRFASSSTSEKSPHAE